MPTITHRLAETAHFAFGSAESDACLRRIQAETEELNAIAWSPNTSILAAPLRRGVVAIWFAGEITEEIARVSVDESNVTSIAWSPNGEVLVVGQANASITVRDTKKDRTVAILEGHTGPITWVEFTRDSTLLFSKSTNGQTRIWSTSSWQPLGTLPFTGEDSYSRSAFGPLHDGSCLLATSHDNDTRCQIWRIEPRRIEERFAGVPAPNYTNAKVVLVGDTGVGKSGLGLVLTGQPFRPTDSTHGKRIWMLDYRQLTMDNGSTEIRETLLWDLAGQPGYRLVHQLHLDEVALALVVFDARSETDPFAGVRHWDRALRQAERINFSGHSRITTFLVAARVDRGGVGVSQNRIRALLAELRILRYFETSAKEGWGTMELLEAIKETIDWSQLPKIVSTDLFQQIKGFLLREKEAGRILSAVDDLYRNSAKLRAAHKKWLARRISKRA